MLLLLNRADATAVVPQQLVNDQRERTDTLTDRVRRALNEGQADLLSVATLIGADTSPADMRTVLERTRLEHDRYQSLYVVDATGKVVAHAGDTPHQPVGKAADGGPIQVLNDSGKKPVIAGEAGIPGRDGATVVGEFRIEFINGLLKRPGLGQVSIVDEKQRIIGGNTGYRAFQELPGERLRTLVAGTNQKTGVSMHPSGILYRDGGKVQIAAAAPFVGGGAAKSLGWTVVSLQPASSLAIPEYRRQNLTVLAGLLGMAAAIACLGWLHIVVVRPLRALADQAEALMRRRPAHRPLSAPPRRGRRRHPLPGAGTPAAPGAAEARARADGAHDLRRKDLTGRAVPLHRAGGVLRDPAHSGHRRAATPLHQPGAHTRPGPGERHPR